MKQAKLTLTKVSRLVIGAKQAAQMRARIDANRIEIPIEQAFVAMKPCLECGNDHDPRLKFCSAACCATYRSKNRSRR